MHTPFRGLQPFTEADARYFFGRDTDTQLIAAHLLTTRLTVFYGASGVGKSSLLMAGVAPYLERLGDSLLFIIRDWHHASFFERIKSTLCEHIWGSQEYITLEFIDLLKRATTDSGKTIVFVFDQFEDYFDYHPSETPFEAQLAIATNTFDLDVNFLLSLREDSLALLDRLQGRLPELWANAYRLEHLNREMAVDAMTGPLKMYRTHEEVAGPVEIESAVIETLLSDCIPQGAHTSTASSTIPPVSPQASEVVESRALPVEAAVLQLVLEQLWRKEVSNNATTMRLKTLQKMGGVNYIMESHLNNLLLMVGDSHRHLCAQLLDRLVTPSGRKIAYSRSDLCAMLKIDQSLLQPILQGFSQGDARILRTLPPAPGEPDNPRYELFHDKLAEAARSWLRRYQQEEKSRAVHRKQVRRQGIVLSSVIIFFFCLAAGKYFYDDWFERQPFSYIDNLSNSKQYPLVHDVTFLSRYVGETLPDYYLKISPTRIVSRIHLMILRNLEAQDMRTSFGTMVNAEFLPYGQIHRLQDGDILSLAGNETFRFSKPAGNQYFPKRPERKDIVPDKDQWGVFIDGKQRRIMALSTPVYYVSYQKGYGYQVTETDPGDALAVIESDYDGGLQDENNQPVRGIYIQDMNDNEHLYVTVKDSQNDAYKYSRFIVDNHKGRTLLGTTREVQPVLFDYNEHNFQIVTISRDDGL